MSFCRSSSTRPTRSAPNTSRLICCPWWEAPRGYETFQTKDDGCIKVVLQPDAAAPSSPNVAPEHRQLRPGELAVRQPKRLMGLTMSA